MSKRKLYVAETTKSNEDEEELVVQVRSRQGRKKMVRRNNTTSENTPSTTTQPLTAIPSTSPSTPSSNPSPLMSSPSPRISENDKKTLDQQFGRFIYTVNLLYNRGFSDFTLNALNEKCEEMGEVFTIDTLQCIQSFIPELFVLYFNLSNQLCVEVCNNFDRNKPFLITQWKKRITYGEAKPKIEIQNRNVPIKVEASLHTKAEQLPQGESTKPEMKKTLEEIFKENDQKELEEQARSAILSKQFEIDRVCETSLIIYT